MKEWWHFHVWKQFNNKIFKQTLTEQDIKSKPLFMEGVQCVDAEGYVHEEPVNTQVVKIEKNGKLYVLKKEYIQDMPLNPDNMLNCYLKESDKTIYGLITDYQTARIKPTKTMTFKEFIHEFNPIEHSDPRSRTFLVLLTIATKHKPTKIAICSEPASGKTSNFNILRNITNDVVIQRTPTLAVLETILYYNKVLLLEELSSLSTSEVRQIEPVIFVGGDGSPEMQKHSLARKSAMNNIDLTELSFIFPHNRPQDLQEGTKFMIDIWKNPAAFQSRFPCILIEGKVLSQLGTPGKKKAIELVEEHYKEMLEVSKNTLYFIKNIDVEMHHYNRSKLQLKDHRQYPNIEGLIDVIDAYCDTQIEFDEWIEWLNYRMKSYSDMLKQTVFERKKKVKESDAETKIVEEYI